MGIGKKTYIYRWMTTNFCFVFVRYNDEQLSLSNHVHKATQQTFIHKSQYDNESVYIQYIMPQTRPRYLKQIQVERIAHAYIYIHIYIYIYIYIYTMCWNKIRTYKELDLHNGDWNHFRQDWALNTMKYPFILRWHVVANVLQKAFWNIFNRKKKRIKFHFKFISKIIHQ